MVGETYLMHTLRGGEYITDTHKKDKKGAKKENCLLRSPTTVVSHRPESRSTSSDHE